MKQSRESEILRNPWDRRNGKKCEKRGEKSRGSLGSGKTSRAEPEMRKKRGMRRRERGQNYTGQ